MPHRSRENRVPPDHVLVKLFGCELRYPEYGLAILAIWWGAWQCLFVNYAGRSSYRYMEAVGDPWVWGGTVIVLGVWLIWALNTNRRTQRRWALQALTVFWVLVVATLGIPNWKLTALPMYSAIVAFHVAAYLRLSGAITLN